MSETRTALDLFADYQEKISEFLKFDELNLKDTQMSLPSVRHYWVGRMMHHKQEINKLKRLRASAYKKVQQKIEQDSPVNLTHKTLSDSVNSHEIIQKIDEEIINNELLVEYLSKVEMNFRDAQYGLNNLTKIITLETT